MLRTALILLLNLLLLSSPTLILADEETSQKDTTADWEKRLEMLRSVPYIALSESEVDEEETGVQLYDPEKAFPGYNLYCTRSSGTAYLMDMEGRVVHRWTYAPKRGSAARHAVMNDHAIMLANGDLVVLKKKEGVVKVNWDSELIWEKELYAHHEVFQAPDGSFYVLIQEVKEHRGLEVWFDSIVHLSADGEELDRWFSYEHLDQIKEALDTDPFLDTVLDRALAKRPQGDGEVDRLKNRVARRYRYDYFHTNAVSVLPDTPLGEKDSRFQQGNLLVCFRNVDQIAVLEKDTYRILWSWGVGQLEGPHHPTMLEDGHILVFNNGVKRRYSSVVELDPLSGEIVWEYKAKSPGGFYSFSRGSAQRLPNGNTLICESDHGRVFEVTKSGEVVWRWQNPVMVGKHCETFYRMMRLPLAQVDGLLKR